MVTWGSPLFGGDSSAVQDQLRNVQQVHATGLAFAAILADATVVTWGEAATLVVTAVQSSSSAFNKVS